MATEAKSLGETMKMKLQVIPKRAITNNTVPITRIPALFREIHKDLYQPKMVSIGPYHHNEEIFGAMEEQKLHFLRDFLEHNPQVNLDAYINVLQSVKDRARDFYSETIQLSDDKFVQMLLLDGCFILEIVLTPENDQQQCFPYWTEWDFLTILSDLLLIENQIPFFVLEKLYATSKGLDGCETPVEPDLKSLVVNNLFVYLVDSTQCMNHGERGNGDPINHLLHLYHEISLPYPEITTQHSPQRRKNSLVIPSATELFDFGFRLDKLGSINSWDVTLYNGIIKIPQLIINSTKQILLINLLAFEHGLEVTKRRWTGLMVMMNCLLKTESDLKILQNRGIIINLLPREDEMIQFISQMSRLLTTDFSYHCFSELFEKVNQRCEDPPKKWRAKLNRDYFKDPWQLISFMSSIAALAISMVQAAVAVLAYYKSKNSN